MKYRPELDGLRALAVLAVIFFHMNFDLFQGGFIGVDVFFVISGYLITSLIITDLKQDKFSLVYFYERRVRRILPALLVVLATTYVFSWFFMLPDEHKSIGQYVVASLSFASNILFYIQNTDYFKLATDENPLLHTWSLAVEEQYYILFPLLLMLLWRQHKLLIFILMGCFLASILLANWQLNSQPIAAFYLLPSRVWELLAGALTAFYLSSTPAPKVAVGWWSSLGLLGIVLPIFLFNSNTPTPSFYTLIPVLGSVLVIVFAQSGTLSNTVLSHPWTVAVGLISYSLYLWHQPVLVYAQVLLGSFSSLEKIFTLLPLIFILAYLTWFFIERYFRNKQQASLKRLTFFVMPLSIVLLSLGIMGQLTNGFETRTQLFQRLASNIGFGKQCNGSFQYQAACASSKAPEVAALGNSYMMHFSKNLTQQYSRAGVLQLTKEGCEIGLVEKDLKLNKNTCVDFYKNALQTIKSLESIKLVVLSSPFNGVLDDDYYASLQMIVQSLNEHGLPVLVLGPTPDAPFNVGKCLVRQQYLPIFGVNNTSCDFVVSDKQLEKVAKLQKLAEQAKQLKFVDITEAICPQGKCQMRLENGLLMYTDRGHLSVEAASYVLNKVSQQLPKL